MPMKNVASTYKVDVDTVCPYHFGEGTTFGNAYLSSLVAKIRMMLIAGR
jgi:hypothetical protein